MGMEKEGKWTRVWHSLSLAGDPDWVWQIWLHICIYKLTCLLDTPWNLEQMLCAMKALRSCLLIIEYTWNGTETGSERKIGQKSKNKKKDQCSQCCSRRLKIREKKLKRGCTCIIMVWWKGAYSSCCRVRGRGAPWRRHQLITGPTYRKTNSNSQLRTI